MKIYALVGNKPSENCKPGLQSFLFDTENANMTFIGSCAGEMNIGAQFVDSKNNIDYVVDEVPNQRDRIGGGGYLAAIHIEPSTGVPELINFKPTLATMPAYCCKDKSGRYMIVVHHTLMNVGTRLVVNEDGTYSNEVVFDDSLVDLFRLNEDGSVGEICDVKIHAGTGRPGLHAKSNLHSVYVDPSGELYIISDKGLDNVYAYKIDREKGKLILTHTESVEDGSAPRYGAFHPTLPYFYGNNEASPNVYTYKYDVKAGTVKKISSACSVMDGEYTTARPTPSDIRISKDGRYIYASIREINKIAVFETHDDGSLTLLQNIDCNGKNPRGIGLTPDGRFLMVANMSSGKITAFKIFENGLLELLGDVAQCPAPGNIAFFEADNV